MSEAAPQPRERCQSALAKDLHQRVLRPYKEHCRYVDRATLTRPRTPVALALQDPTTWLRLDAECGVPQSCYIDDTGHFNAVEFNIVYNQMLYLCLAEVTRQRLLIDLPSVTLDDFYRHQLPNVLIVDYRARFRRPMQSRRFAAWFALCDLQIKPGRNLVLLDTCAGCSTPDGGAAENEVKIALVNWLPQ